MEFEPISSTAARTEDRRPGRPGVAHVHGQLLFLPQEASTTSVEASSSTSFEACTSCTMHHVSSTASMESSVEVVEASA